MILDLESCVEKYGLKIRRALHVGAHHGDEDPVYKRLGIEPVYVEANPEVFAILRQKLPARECHNVAITDYAGKVKLRVTSADMSSSILKLKKHKEIYADIKQVKVVKVPCTTIDRLLAETGHEVELINMDIQGAELLALKGATKSLESVQGIMTEVNREELYRGCALIGEIDDYLGGFGFRRVEECFKYHPSWGDAFYVK